MKRVMLIGSIIVLGILSAVIYFKHHVSVIKSACRVTLLNEPLSPNIPKSTTRGAVFFALNELLQDPDSNVRKKALMALMPYKRRFSGPSFVKLLKDSDPEIRFYAAVGLGEIYYKSAVFQLSKSLESEEDWRVASEMAIALGRFKKIEAAPYLKNKFANSKDKELQVTLAAALLSLTSQEEYRILLLTVFNNGSEQQFGRLAYAVANIGDEQMSTFLVNSCNDVKKKTDFLNLVDKIRMKSSFNDLMQK